MTGAAPSIRRAVAADANALTSCFEAAYAPYLANLPGLPPVTEGLADDIAAHVVWVAERAGRILGGLVLVEGRGASKLANLAVHPQAAGRSIGASLIAVAEAHCRARGDAVLTLNTHVAMTGSQRLYRRLGWRETGRDGVTVSMAKTLH